MQHTKSLYSYPNGPLATCLCFGALTSCNVQVQQQTKSLTFEALLEVWLHVLWVARLP
jgi:hypothetical protein